MKKITIIIFLIFTLFISVFLLMYKKVNIYFYNPSLDSGLGGVECSEKGLVKAHRWVKKDNLLSNTIIELLKGPNQKEKQKGFTSEFPIPGLSLLKIETLDNELSVYFDDKSNKTSGGSCRVSILRLQIEKTLKENSGINNIKIKPEEIFQP